MTKSMWPLPGIALLLTVGVWLIPAPLIRYFLAFILLWIMPGLCWKPLLPQGFSRVERWVAALGISFVITPLIALLCYYIPGPLTRAQLLIGLLISIFSPSAFQILTKSKSTPPDKPTNRTPLLASSYRIAQAFWRNGRGWILVAILIATALRLTNLGYSEFQGDEGTVMVRAAQALEGEDTILFQHKKGPAELLTVMTTWRLTGVTNEWMARLPFTWANLLGIIAVAMIALRVSSPYTAGTIALILAIEGYLTAFARIAQYQSLVFLLGTLGLLALIAYQESGHPSLVVLSAGFLAGGFLGHYDAALVLPAGLLLIGSRLWRERQHGWCRLRTIGMAGLLGLVLVALFYIPFLKSPFMETTQAYLGERVGSMNRFFNRIGSMAEAASIYNSTYLLGGLLVALIIQIWATSQKWGHHHIGPIPGWVFIGLVILLLGTAATGALWPESWEVGKSTIAWIPFVALLAIILATPGQSMSQRAVWLWLGVPAFFYLFRVSSPNTHIHTFFSPWIVVAGMGLAEIRSYLKRHLKQISYTAIIAVAVLLYGVCGYYTVMMFVRHDPEYLRTFSESKSPLYWTPYNEIPETGLFGFPYQAGWKVIGYLIDEGKLKGSYQSNEESSVTNFYTRQALRWPCPNPDTYITAINVQDAKSLPWDEIEENYQRAGVVNVEEHAKMEIYTMANSVLKTPAEDAAEEAQDNHVAIYAVRDYAWAFTLNTTPANVATAGLKAEAPLPQDYISLDYTFGDMIKLKGYTVHTNHAKPGGYIDLTLLWESIKPAPQDYQVFTHLYDGETMHGQLDRQPMCSGYPTSEWKPGETLVDRYRIPIAEDASPGDVPLIIGMYDLATLQRLPVHGGEQAMENAIHLTEVSIQTP